MISYNPISPRSLTIPIRQQRRPPQLKTSPPSHYAPIDSTIDRNLPPPTKTSFPPNICDLLPTIDLMKMMTANLGLFDAASIYSFFVDLLQIELHPTYLFSNGSTGQDTYCLLWSQYRISVPSGGIPLSPLPPFIRQDQEATYFFAAAPQS